MSTSSEKDTKRDFGQDVEFQPTQSHAEETIAHDAVFGEITDKGPNYRNVGWIGTVALMMKTQIGLGVLSIPAVFHSLGLVPGMIALIAIAVITTWSGYVVGTFKLRHPEVYGIDDAGALMFGRFGRELFGIAFCLFWIFVAGSGMLGISIALNAVSMHGACTAVFVAVAAIIGFGLASIRTLGRISWLAWVGLICLLTAIFTVTIAVGVQDRPADAPQEGTWKSDYKIVNKGTPFTEAISAVSSLIFAYAGTPAYFAIAAEMRNPQHYTRSLIVCQAGMTITYIVIGCVVYVYCGSYVATPALGSAGAMIKKVAYGLALPGLIASTTLVIHYSAKYAFVRMLRGSKHLTSNSLTHWATWLGCTTTATVIAYLIASGIPVFGGLVSLVGALLGTLMSFQPMGCMWLYDNWSRRREATLGWYLMVAYSVFVVVSGTFLMIGGTYGSIVGIIDSMKETGGSPAWACADNSNSV
ncbi:hypothetical protein CEP54_011628 [Fusarium duplospermum]|uniref:Amino acid transporter transmembrane domain-containing protein n=1 Tax=Fusarium duplospermum TaxID=1325734 RepID=A0A428PDC2_9HYPO|nr:hypothetical protein CEP54_011628 [Fusarium duplospermum]